MGQDEHFDEEILRYFEPLNRQIKQLQEKVVALEGELAAQERRELLRVRGNQFCRVCNGRQTHHGMPPNPPISDLEQKYHDAQHATGAPGDPSRRLSPFNATIS
jgi:hypothetical protein